MTAGSVAGSTPATRHAVRGVLVVATALLLLIVVVVGAIGGWESSPAPGSPSSVAIADVPTEYLALYEQAASRYGVDWAVLAAIGKIECDHGRSHALGCSPPGSVNAAGATGPMQFLGTTWRVGTPPLTVPPPGPPAANGEGYATDGDGDGLADVWNPADAIAAAARLLRANGAPADYRRAIFAYNHDAAYVDAVLAQAEKYRGAFAPAASGNARTALEWAVAHVGTFTYNLGPPTDRGGSLQDMQSREPAG